MLTNGQKQEIAEGDLFVTHGSDEILRSISSAEEVGELKHLNFNFDSCSSLTPLRRLAGLEDLRLMHVADASVLSAIAACSNLKQLSLDRFDSVKTLSFLAESKAPLESLILTSFAMLETIDGIQSFSSLKRLDLVICPRLIDISAISFAKDLETVVLSSEALQDISPLLNLPKLNLINLSGSAKIPVKQLTELRRKFPSCYIIE
jgi:Leucine-rich repeat (LRR) protein